MNLSQAIIAYEGHLTAAVESILSQVVSSGTQCNYTNHNSDLILWIYNKEEWREQLLRYWMVEILIADEEREKKKLVLLVNMLWKKSTKATTTAPLY